MIPDNEVEHLTDYLFREVGFPQKNQLHHTHPFAFHSHWILRSVCLHSPGSTDNIGHVRKL